MIAGWVFALSAAAVLYVIVGYPLLLGLMARLWARPVRKASVRKTVSVLIAVRNGAPWIRRKLESILALNYPRELVDVLVISDESDDGTDDIIKQFDSHGVRLMRVPQGGKPAALTAAFPLVQGEILLLTDVRQEIEPDSLTRIIDCFADPVVGVVSGELLIRESDRAEEANVGLYWRYESWIRRQLSAVDSTLGATGPFYAIRRELAIPIPADTLLDDVFLPLSILHRGYRLIVEPTARAIDYPTSLETEFRRKVRTLAGNYQILQIYPWLLGPGNRMWFHFVSYKLGRLLLPYFLIAILVSSFFLPVWLAVVTVLGQAMLYGAALADSFIGNTSLLKKLSSPARTFVVLNCATIVALKVFFVPPRSLWTPTRTRAAG